MPFPSLSSLTPGAKPLEPFGKGSNALKAGTPDARPMRSYHAISAQPSVQPPAGVERKDGVIRGPRGKARRSEFTRPLGVRLNAFRQPYRQRHALAHLGCGRNVRARHLALPLQLAEQDLEALLEKLLPEFGVLTCARKVRLSDR